MSDYYLDFKVKFQRIRQLILRYVLENRQYFSKWFLICFLTISFAHLTKRYLFSIAIVTGASMEPWLKAGDLVLITKVNNRFHPGDVIAVRTTSSEQTFVKRLIAIGPGRTFIEQGVVHVDDAIFEEDVETPPIIDTSLYWCLYSSVFEVPSDSIFVLGDNRCQSFDSRSFGPIPKRLIQGKVQFKLLSIPLLLNLTI